MSTSSPLGRKIPTGPRALKSKSPIKPPPQSSLSTLPSIPSPDCIDPILPAQFDPKHQGSLKSPHGYIRYDPHPEERTLETSEEAIRRRHTEDVFHEIIKKIEETFDASYDELSDEMSVSGVLRDQMNHVGMDGAMRYLRKFCQLNEEWYDRTRARLDSTKGKGKGKARQDPEEDQDQDYEMEDGEIMIKARKKILDEERLEVFLRIKWFVHDVLSRRDKRGVQQLWGCDKLDKLVEVLTWMKTEAESKAVNGESRWNCLVVAPNDRVVRSIQYALQSTQSILSAHLTTQAIFDGDEMNQEETGDRGKKNKVTVDFALAEYNVLVIPAVSGVEWRVSPCHVIHYDPVEPEVAKTIPLRWNTMTKGANRFYVFKRLDGPKNKVRAEDVRLERSYGLRRRPKASGEIDYPIRGGDLGKSMDELLAESGMRVDLKPRALTVRGSQAEEDARKAARKAARRYKAAEQAKRDEALLAAGLPPYKHISKKKKLKMRYRKEAEAAQAVALEKRREAYGPDFDEFMEQERLFRNARAEKRRIAAEEKAAGDVVRRAAHREAIAARRGGLRSAAGTKFEEALELIDFTKDVGPMNDAESEKSAVWSSSDNDEGEEALRANRPSLAHPIAQKEEDELDELDELDDKDMPGSTSGPCSPTPATRTSPETPSNVKDLLDEEAISMVLEEHDELMDDSSADEGPMQNGHSQIATSEPPDAEVDAPIPFMPSLPESPNRGQSSNSQRRTSSSVILDWRVYSQEELGLPRLGLAMPRKGATALQDYTGPSGRKLHFEREWNGNKEHHVKNTCYSWPQLSNSAGTAILSPKSAADVFREVQTHYNGAFRVEDADGEVLGAHGARRLWVDLPSHMIAGPIVSDSGNKGKRGLEILHFTFAAALYLAGWLDHGFNFSYTRPTLETGNVWPSPISRPSLRLLPSPANNGLQGNLDERDAGSAVPTANAGNAGPSSNTQVQPAAGSHSRTIKGLPAAKPPNLVSIEPKTPKLWTMRKSNTPGAYCAAVCRIKIPGNMRRFRTVCILTTDRLNIPLGRSLPTCKVLPGIEAVLATGQDVSLDKRQWEAAHDYTLALFSIPRKRQLYAVRGQLPYYILPMHSTWQAADEATSEVRFKDAVNVSSNIAWTEIFTRIDGGTTRMPSGQETAGQALDSLSLEALYQVNGSAMPYEVSRIARDADSREKARSRASGPGQQVDTGLAIVDGPAFVLHLLPDLWSNGLQTSVGAIRTVTVSPKHEPAMSISKSIHQSAQLLPWIMWTIDGLLLAREVNTIYLDSRADPFDVLAALSTTASGRDIDCEVLEFAGDTYWKLAATAHFYYASPHQTTRDLGEQVRSVTDNAPLALGMQRCGASEYVQNAPIVPSAFLPHGCGVKNAGESSISYPRALATMAGRKAIADASEALAGAVGRLKDHELIQRVCTKLQIDRLSSDTSWKDLAEMPALDFGSINATLQEVDAIYALTGHSFADRSMLDMILRNKPRGELEQGAAARLNFLGTAVFEYLLMGYLVDQGRIQSLTPGQLTQWRNFMYSHIAMATLWVASGLSKHAGRQPWEATAKLQTFEEQLTKTITTRTEATMAWTRIANPPRADNHIHGLFGGVLIDSGWSFDAARAVFNKFCLPFFARFVGSYDPIRLAKLPDTSTARERLARKLNCREVFHSVEHGVDGTYRAIVYSHDHSLGDASSVYESAALAFAYREAFNNAGDRSFNRNACRCHKPIQDFDARSSAADLIREEPVSVPSTRPKRTLQPTAHDAESDDDFEIIDDPKTVARVQQMAMRVSGSRVRTSSEAESSDRGQNKKRKL